MITIKLLANESRPNSEGVKNPIVNGAIKKVSPRHKRELTE